MEKNQYIYQLVQQSAREHPQKIAVSDSKRTLTYQQLEQESDAFCKILKSHNIEKGDLVALSVKQKSTTLLSCILGILKSGAAYVPISPSYPKLLYKDLLSSVKPQLLVTCKKAKSVNSFQELHIQKTHEIDDQRRETLSTHNLAYIMYTSGTTGEPKGVPISHQNLIATYNSWLSVYQLSSNDRHLQMADFTFDVFTGDWVRALCSGATLILCQKDRLLHSSELYNIIEKESISIAEFVPAVLRKLSQYVRQHKYELSTFRLLVCGSDIWSVGECLQTASICPEHTRIFNSYGLTETTIDSTYFECKPHNLLKKYSKHDIVPIGKTFPHVTIDLLDENQKPVAPGCSGEIVIGGQGVSPIGYLAHPSLTKDRFKILDTHGLLRCYKTGDQAKISEDGNIIFCGRNTLQTNIRGKRVDLLTVEAVLNQYPGLSRGIVIANRKNGRAYLHAFCCTDETVFRNTLIGYLKERLPSHFVPHQFHVIDQIPLTRHGKVDRNHEKFNACPMPEEFEAAMTPLERAVASIWYDHLPETADISAVTPFCCLQKKSLSFVQMIANINSRYATNIKPKISVSTVRAIAKEITQQHNLNLVKPPSSSIAIIGGGPAAISLCRQLIKQLIQAREKHVEITIFEKNDTIGHGVPYQHQSEDAYILNLPTDMMKLGGDQENQFQSWYQRHHADKYDSAFPPRHIFGQYINDNATELAVIAKGHGINLKYVTNTEINGIRKLKNKQYRLSSAKKTHTTDFVIFCTGHMASCNYREFIGISGYRHNSWAKHARRQIQKTEAVAVLGSRISAIDVIMKLKSVNHRGKIALFSRDGMLPAVLSKEIPPYNLKYLTLDRLSKHRKADGYLDLDLIIKSVWSEICESEQRILNLNSIITTYQQCDAQAWLKKEIRKAEQGPKPWQQVLFAFYPLIPTIWSQLKIADKQRFLRDYHSLFLTYLAAFPLENAKKLHRWIKSNEVEIHGGLQSVTHEDKCFKLSTVNGSFSAPHLFNATGPGYKASGYPIFHEMEKSGLSIAHPCGGLRVDPHSQQLISKSGHISSQLFAIGELTRGEFWATTDMSQVNAQCEKVAPALIKELKTYRKTALNPESSREKLTSLRSIVSFAAAPG